MGGGRVRTLGFGRSPLLGRDRTLWTWPPALQIFLFPFQGSVCPCLSSLPWSRFSLTLSASRFSSWSLGGQTPLPTPVYPPHWGPYLWPGWISPPLQGLDRVLHGSLPVHVSHHLHRRQLGQGVFPMESRWQGVYGPFRDFVRAGCPGDLREALLGFHVQSSRELRRSQEYLCCER